MHREGSRESLSKDFVVIAMPSQSLSPDGTGEKLKKFMDIARKHNPVNLGNSKAGNMFSLKKGYEDLREKTKDADICHAVLTCPEDLEGLLNDLRKADLGLSIVVSGLMDVVGDCCHKANLNPHTVNMSLGIYGNTEKLDSKEDRHLTTMCGHGMITADLILKKVKRIRAGKTTPEKASEELAALCVCGICNPSRSAELLSQMAKKTYE